MRFTNSPWSITAGLLAIIFAVTASAQPRRCQRVHSEEIDLTIQRKNPIALKGPAEVTLRPLNRLRYDVVIGNEVVSSPGPDLSVLGLIPAFPKAVKTAAAKETSKPPAGGSESVAIPAMTLRSLQIEADSMIRELPSEQRETYADVLARFRRELSVQPLAEIVEWADAWRNPLGSLQIRDEHLVEHVFTRLQTEIASAETELDEIRTAATAAKIDVEQARDRLEDLVRRSDQILADSYPDPGTLVQEIAPVRSAVEHAVQTPWPKTKTEDLAKKLRQIGRELEKLPLLRGFTTWRQSCDPLKGLCNGRRYEAALDDVEALTEGVAVFAQGNEAWKAHSGLRAALQGWLTHLRGLQGTSFAKSHRVACDYPFFDSRTTNLQVVLTDRLEKDRSKATRTIQVAQIACPSHFSVTAGVGVARIEERDIAFVSAPAPPAPAEDEAEEDGEEDSEENGLIKVFGFDNRSEEQINPTFLVSTRLCQNRTWDLHISFGTILDFDRPKESAAFGYLGGLTASIKDQLFITAGLQAQRVPKLAGGFEIGQEVPADLTTPPLEKDWDFGPVLAVTYKVN